MINMKSAGERGKTPAPGAKSSSSLAPDRILVSDKDGSLAPLFPATEALWTSDGSPWTAFIIEEHPLQPIEFPERASDRYLIALHLRPATEDDELPLIEVGLSVGFQNQNHFTTLFHQQTGVTPKTYRDGIQEEPGCPNYASSLS
jgi:AraC-like DNA-binding protein